MGKHVATSGKPTSKWTGIAFRDGGVPYSLGFFGSSVETGRLLWFPTAQLKATMYDEDTSGQLTHYLGRPMDHLTLDPVGKHGRHRSHFTYEDGGQCPNVPHFRNPGQLIPWFSVFLPNLNEHLRVVPESQAIKFPADRTDPDYPPQLTEDGAWEIVDPRPPLDVPCFVQFDVWAGMWPGWENDAWGFMPAAQQMGLITPGRDIQSRAIRQSFGEDRGCFIVMSWVPGQIDRPRIPRPSRIEGTIPAIRPMVDDPPPG